MSLNPALPCLERFTFPTAAVVTGGGEILAAQGDCEAIYPWASVTKTLTVWSALIAVQRGMLDLDSPAAPFLPGATIAHLMSHSSGVAQESNDAVARPGTRRIYSNRGTEILGERLEEATGMAVGEWIEITVLEPLGMSSVEVPGSPARSGVGTVMDMSILAREYARPTLLRPEIARLACTPHLPDLPGILPGYGPQRPNPFGLGMEIRGEKTPHWSGKNNSPATFGHFGRFGSLLWVDPQADRQLAFLGAQHFGPEHVAIWPDLCDEALAL